MVSIEGRLRYICIEIGLRLEVETANRYPDASQTPRIKDRQHVEPANGAQLGLIMSNFTRFEG